MGTVVPFRGPKKQQKHGHRARDRQVQVQSLVPRAHGRARAHGRRRAAIVLYRFTQNDTSTACTWCCTGATVQQSC